MAYDTGDLVRCLGRFRDPENGDAYLDPQVVKFKFKAVSAPTVTYHYGVDDEVVRRSTGIYYVDLDADTPGLWTFRWESEGTGQAAQEGKFTVKASTV